MSQTERALLTLGHNTHECAHSGVRVSIFLSILSFY